MIDSSQQDGEDAALSVAQNKEHNQPSPKIEEPKGMVLRNNPKLTPAGKDNLIITLKSQIKSCKKRLARQLMVMEPLLTSSDINKMNNETTILDRIYTDITEFHTRLCQTLNKDADREELDAAMVEHEVIDSDYFSLKTRLCT